MGSPLFIGLHFSLIFPNTFLFNHAREAFSSTIVARSSSMVLAWDSMISLCFRFVSISKASCSSMGAVTRFGISSIECLHLLSLSFNILFDCIKVVKNNRKSKPASYLFTDICQCLFRSESRLCLPFRLSSLMPSTMMTRSLQVMGYEWVSGS